MNSLFAPKHTLKSRRKARICSTLLFILLIMPQYAERTGCQSLMPRQAQELRMKDTSGNTLGGFGAEQRTIVELNEPGVHAAGHLPDVLHVAEGHEAVVQLLQPNRGIQIIHCDHALRGGGKADGQHTRQVKQIGRTH